VPPWQCQSGNDSSSVDRCGNDDSGNATMTITVVTMAAVAMTVVCGLYVKGITRTDDLKILFKNTTFNADDMKTYIIDLLNKFEMAFIWNNHNLLTPSLLPMEVDMRRE
ncbi:hypothetical protein LSAT2_029831, partial [Lamellibrachia satsuma]